MSPIIQLGAGSLALQSLPSVTASVPAPVHHIITIDISGSMSSDLPALRLHLKNKLSTLVAENDTVTIVWFSGRGQFGALVEGLKIHTASDLRSVHAAIDRFLQPIGMTGFKEPLQEIENIVARLKAWAGGYLVNLFFMTDGYDNQWSERDILELCSRLAKSLDSAAVIEYGWNCNRPLLTKMAEVLGGKLVFSDDFPSYIAAFEGSLTGLGGKKVPVVLDHPAEDGLAFALSGASLLTFSVDESGVVMVPEGLTELGYFTVPPGVPFDRHLHAEPLLYAALAMLAQRMDTKRVFGLLASLGDVALVQQFTNCFSKEDYSRFIDDVLQASVDVTARYRAGYDPHAVPREDAYTVLHLLSELASDDENLLYPYHPSFKYERTTAGSAARSDDVQFAVGDKSAGYPVNGIVWNETRPNVSIRVAVAGVVNLPKDRPAGVPETLNSVIFRNYTIIRDGVVHTRALPVSLSAKTFAALQANGLLAGETWRPAQVYSLEFPRLPVINRSMVTTTTAKDTFELVVELMRLKAAQKVFNEYTDRVAPKTSKKLELLYGEAATAWLKDRGVTDSGFNPPSDIVKSGDVYQAKELKISVKGLSSLPKVSDVETAVAAKKTLKLGEVFMATALSRIEAFTSSPVYTGAADREALLTTWLESERKALTVKTRELMEQLAQRKFAIVVGHTWFSEFPSLDEGSLAVAIPEGAPVQVTAALKTIEVAL